ncbi:MAG: endolytic transglycosylase MltG [Thermodesulfobacteriota bacterium]
MAEKEAGSTEIGFLDDRDLSEAAEAAASSKDEITDPKPSVLPIIRKWAVRLISVAGILFVLALLAGFVAWLEFRVRLMPVSDKKNQIVVEIPSGASVRQIGRLLQEKGVIRSAEAFRYYVTLKKTGGRIKAGEQVLDSSQNTPEVLAALIKGSFKLYPVTVPEGLTMAQIAVLIHKAGLVDEQAFLDLGRDQAFIKAMGLQEDSLEGYLFPDTYNFIRNVTTKEVVKAMVERFWQVWEKYRPLAEIQKLTRHEIVTLASLVEKETGAAAERPLVASVFHNRLAKGMKLETDPTVIYGLKSFDGNLTKKDLQTPSPYNTYLIPGLPPGPICSPGEASLKAVLEPAKSDYLFFVSRNDGTHQFSRTLAEHNKAVDQYQKSLKKKPTG